jgi:pimeloyl-ACP methyl ester carboxylesterase
MVTKLIRNFRATVSALLSTLIALSGCTAPETILSPYERKIGVHDDVSREFHSSLYYPKGLSLQYPGYVVGIEKANQNLISGPKLTGRPSFLANSPKYFESVNGERDVKWKLGSLDLLQKLEDDNKSMFVSHVTRFHLQQVAAKTKDITYRPYAYIDSCFLYNSLGSPFFSRAIYQARPSVEREWRDLSAVIAWKQCEDAPKWTGMDSELQESSFYMNGVTALSALSRAVAHDLKSDGYTHVLVLVMGWNTVQDEAIRNFNDLAGNLVEASLESESARTTQNGKRNIAFRPLVIGVTWPSFWNKGVLNVLSYASKAHDADELGISWMNLLINRLLPDAMKATGLEVPVILIGHSFGARVVTRTASASPALIGSDDRQDGPLFSGANLVIGLQGAVSINRFWPAIEGTPPGDEGAPLREFNKLKNTKFVLTASSHDTAAGGPLFWFDPSGSIKSFALACGKAARWRSTVFECMTASDTSGLITPANTLQRWEGFSVCNAKGSQCRGVGSTVVPSDGKVLYIDVSNGITEFNTLNTGGNAHSDIYRLPMGRLLWLLISSLKPSTQEPIAEK